MKLIFESLFFGVVFASTHLDSIFGFLWRQQQQPAWKDLG